MIGMVAVLLVSAAPPAAGGLAMELAAAVPGESLAALLIAAAPPEAPGKIAAVAGLAQRLRDIGVMSRDGAWLWVDVLRVVLSRAWPTAWVLHDVRLQSLPGGSNRLERLSASLVVHDRGAHDLVAAHIRLFLQNHTSERTAQLEEFDLQGRRFYRLMDQRLPEWAVFEWGPAEGFYVLSIGRGASTRILQALSSAEQGLRDQPFFAAACAQLHADGATVAAYINGQGLRAALGSGGGRVTAVSEALGASQAEQSLWTLRCQERALLIDGLQRGPAGDERLVIGGSAETLGAQVPPDASWYLAITQPAAAVVRRARDVYLAGHRPETQRRLQDGWDLLAAEQDLNFTRDLLDPLGDYVLVHDAPRHPLGLPGMLSIVVPIRQPPQSLRLSLDKLFTYCAARLEEVAQPAGMFAPRLLRADDGVWYCQAGLYGPALSVTGNGVLLSYSPVALRALLPPGPAPAEAP